MREREREREMKVEREREGKSSKSARRSIISNKKNGACIWTYILINRFISPGSNESSGFFFVCFRSATCSHAVSSLFSLSLSILSLSLSHFLYLSSLFMSTALSVSIHPVPLCIPSLYPIRSSPCPLLSLPFSQKRVRSANQNQLSIFHLSLSLPIFISVSLSPFLLHHTSSLIYIYIYIYIL